MESTGRFRVISRPMVFTSNNKKAIIANGQEIPVPVSTLSNVNNGAVVNSVASVQSSIEFKKVALQLEVVPLINSEKEVSRGYLTEDRQCCSQQQCKYRREFGADDRHSLHSH
jgi:Type II secretory pathway, component PulD